MYVSIGKEEEVKKERMVGRRCRGESVGCLEGQDEDQPDSSLSKT